MRPSGFRREIQHLIYNYRGSDRILSGVHLRLSNVDNWCLIESVCDDNRDSWPRGRLIYVEVSRIGGQRRRRRASKSRNEVDGVIAITEDGDCVRSAF